MESGVCVPTLTLNVTLTLCTKTIIRQYSFPTIGRHVNELRKNQKYIIIIYYLSMLFRARLEAKKYLVSEPRKTAELKEAFVEYNRKESKIVLIIPFDFCHFILIKKI